MKCVWISVNSSSRDEIFFLLWSIIAWTNCFTYCRSCSCQTTFNSLQRTHLCLQDTQKRNNKINLRRTAAVLGAIKVIGKSTHHSGSGSWGNPMRGNISQKRRRFWGLVFGLWMIGSWRRRWMEAEIRVLIYGWQKKDGKKKKKEKNRKYYVWCGTQCCHIYFNFLSVLSLLFEGLKEVETRSDME